MRLFTRAIFWVLLGISSFSYAAVDIKSGTFSIRRFDQGLGTEFSGFRFSRTYLSTVNFEGLFGYGWCSDLETKLTVTAKGQIVVTECGAGELKVFESADFKAEESAKALKELFSKLQSGGKTLSSAEKEELQKSRVRRTKAIANAQLKFEISKSAYSLNPFPNEEQIQFKNNQFVRTKATGVIQHFDLNGTLVLQKSIRGDSVRFFYEKNKLKEIKSQRGQNITFKYDTEGYLTEMRGPEGITHYTFSEDGHLVKVKQKSGEEKYSYEKDLMTAVDGVEKLKISYNPVTRFVSGVTSPSCEDIYKYQIEKAAMQFKVDFTSNCKGSPKESVSYNFQYQLDSQGALFQKRMVASDGKGKVTSAEYSGDGKPVKIVRAGNTFLFDYDKNNRLISKETDTQRIEYAYGTSGNIVSARVFEKKARKPAAVSHQFNYDSNLRLSSYAVDGDFIKYSYDKRGRLSKIQSKSGSEFSIMNDGLTGNITRITAKGYGHFEMKYTASGQLLKSEWKGDIEKAIPVLSRYELLRTPYEQSLEFGVPK